MKSIAVLGLVGLLAPLLLAEEQPVTARVRLEPARSATEAPRVAFPQIRFPLTKTRPEGLKAPELGEDARYAVVEFGGRSLRLGFDAPGGAFALGLVYAGGEPVNGRARAGGAAGTMVVDFLDVPAGGRRVDVRLFYRGLDLRSAVLQPSMHRRGRAAVAGGVRELILVDADANGRYDDPGDRWIALQAGRNRGAALLRHEASRLDEPQIPFRPDGRALHVDQVARDGSAATLVLATPRKPMERVLARRYGEVRRRHFRRFRRGAAAFATRHDLRRPRVDEPAPWLRLSLSEAKRRAKEQGKPLLVFYFAENNVASYRYDYFTFPDEEVDALLRRFVRVKIDAEKDPEGSYRRSGARLLPALVPYTEDGEPLAFKLMHRTPEGDVRNLAEDESMISGWQRPQEFVINLKRILIAAR